ncbi:MAG: type VI secretion system tube protein Hcp [Burkholderiaceae bacterium]|nr:type VI secretion system tube protein Hcp [Burkholderiaceae bacterium]
MKLTAAGSREIKGESEAEGFEGQIEVDDWSWEIATTTGMKVDKPSQSPRFDDANLRSSRPLPVTESETTTLPSVFRFSKMMDRSSTALMYAMTSGELLTAVVSMEESSTAEFEIEITLTQVRVTHYEVNGKNDKASGEIEEKWHLNYSDINFDYLPTALKDKGKLSVKLTRPAGASTDAPKSKEDQILELAGKFELPALERLWDDMKKRAGQPKPKPVEGEAKGKVG